MNLAIFDFDGTIYQGETLRLFLRVLAARDPARNRAVQRYYLSQAPAYVAYRLGINRLRMMTRAMVGMAALLRDLTDRELADFFGRCLDEARTGFYRPALEKLSWHLERGDRIILLSGAFTRFLALVAGELRCHDWLGTELLFEDGRCVGMGGHAVGPAKAGRLSAYLTEEKKAGREHDLSQAFAYADSLHDLPILELVGRPVAVNPEPRLRAEAIRRGWEII